jgi:cell wall-associated NlpC family hydrolase
MIACRPAKKEMLNVVQETSCPRPIDSSKTPTTDSLLPARIVAFAETLKGTRYNFGCSAPSMGFDCSGFITYVFNHFGITVPRSSVDFTNEGSTIELKNSKPGDLILFTGTNSNIRTVGHIGIIVSNDATGITFIHSSSGKEYAVTITPMNEYYMGRFVKVVRMVN